jgi:hypothetical protein
MSPKLLFQTWVSVTCFASAMNLGLAGSSVAQESDHGSEVQAVNVRVRAIHAESSAPIGEQSSAKRITRCSQLNDIDAKLKKLPFKSFSLLSSQSQRIELMKRGTIFLAGGNELTIRPLYAESGKVGLWMRWTDGAGAKVLDTRLHMAMGESMVAGADAGQDSATVLAIEVDPEVVTASAFRSAALIDQSEETSNVSSGVPGVTAVATQAN